MELFYNKNGIKLEKISQGETMSFIKSILFITVKNQYSISSFVDKIYNHMEENLECEKWLQKGYWHSLHFNEFKNKLEDAYNSDPTIKLIFKLRPSILEDVDRFYEDNIFLSLENFVHEISEYIFDLFYRELTSKFKEQIDRREYHSSIRNIISNISSEALDEAFDDYKTNFIYYIDPYIIELFSEFIDRNILIIDNDMNVEHYIENNNLKTIVLLLHDNTYSVVAEHISREKVNLEFLTKSHVIKFLSRSEESDNESDEENFIRKSRSVIREKSPSRKLSPGRLYRMLSKT